MKQRFTPFLLVLLVVFSCVFSPDKENFVEIDPNTVPPEVSSQTLDFNSDTLYVWEDTRFDFDYKSNNQEIRSVIVSYGDRKFTFKSHLGSFKINPETCPEGIYTLAIKVYTKSGTGSLADILGVEGYEFKKDWVLIVEKPETPKVNIFATIENGFLKFSWNKLDKPYFKSYSLFINDGSHEKVFTDKNTTTFIDSLFVGGEIRLILHVNYKINETNFAATSEYNYNYPITLTFKEDLDSLTISWNSNPFQHKTYFEINEKNMIEIRADTSYTIVAPGLGNYIWYNIAFKPMKTTLGDDYISDNAQGYSIGVNDKIRHVYVDYNQNLNAYFFIDYNKIKSFSRAFEQIGTYEKHWDNYNNSNLEFSKDNQCAYIVVDENLLKLNSNGLGMISSHKLPFIMGLNPDVQVIKNLNDTVFLIGYKSFSESRFILFNAKTNTLIDKSDILSNSYLATTGNYHFAVSSNGKYAAFCIQKGLFLFEIVNSQNLALRFQDSNFYNGCFFDPKYPEKLILNRPNDFQVFDCSKLQVTKTIDRFNAFPVNIDPKTHNILLVSNAKKKIYVYDYENDVLKLEMNHHGMPDDFKLLNNIIFVNSGYHFDISSYVE
jgi:hypothetical protein